MMRYYKYQGAGNDFLVADNRQGLYSLTKDQVAGLCDRRYGFGADGLMLLERSQVADFKMVFYNPDGTGGMMCGNGGRCMVAFAAFLGYRSFNFEAPDGLHQAVILATDEQQTRMTVRLKMTDVRVAEVLSDGDWFVHTGARHRVRFVESGLASLEVDREGRRLRHDPSLQPEGSNVNFVQMAGDGRLQVRTFEKGVEAETYACGTGIVASCLAAHWSGRVPGQPCERISLHVQALRDELQVDFVPVSGEADRMAKDIWLTGPAVQVGEVIATSLP